MTDHTPNADDSCAFCAHAQADLAQYVAQVERLETKYRAFLAKGWALRDSEQASMAGARVALRLRRVFLRMAQQEHPDHPDASRDSSGMLSMSNSSIQDWCRKVEQQLDQQQPEGASK